MAIDDDGPEMDIVDPSALLANAVAEFESAIRRAAFAIANAIIREELTQRSRRGPRSRRMPAQPRTRRSVGKGSRTRTPSLVASSTPSPSPDTKVRNKWTRENTIDELAKLLASGTVIDAVFVTRYGPRGLAAAARKIFGRFDAALNVAALQVARMYPEGPPTRR